MQSARTLVTLALVLGLSAATSCTQSKAKSINPNEGGKKPLVQGPEVPAGTPGAVDPNEQQNGTLNGGVNGASIGISEEEFQKGKTFVNGWDGLADQLPADTGWTVKTLVAPPPPANPAAPAGPVAPANPAQPQSPVPPPSGPQVTPQSPQPTSPAAPATETPDEVVFRIKKGTGRGAWNSPETEVVVKVGKKFTIVNDDDITHQWHTNGSPCQHGSPIKPGASETCTPSHTFNQGPLYDHITEGKFYIRAEQ